MPEWLQNAAVVDSTATAPQIAARLALAALFGWLIGVVYRWKRSGTWIPPTFPLTLVLLSVLIAMVTQVVGDHVARAFSLVGALSIVRFRTVVEDTQDIAFVIFAVVVGMAVGSGDLFVAVSGMLISFAVIVIAKLVGQSPWFQATANGSTLVASRLVLRTGLSQEVHHRVNAALLESIGAAELLAAETIRGGSAFEWTYKLSGATSSDPRSLVEKLANIEGVQGVSWRHNEH